MTAPLCQGCKKPPAEIEEYLGAAREEGCTPDEFVIENEGTYNSTNGHFLCTACYIETGMSASPRGWICP